MKRLYILIIFFGSVSLYAIPSETNKNNEVSSIVLVEELPCVLDEEKMLDKEVTRKTESDKDFSKKLLEGGSICKSNQSSSDTAQTSTAAQNLESYTSGSGTEESAGEAEAPESSSSVNTSNSAQDAEDAENNNSKTAKDLKVERCAQNLNLTGEVEKNLIDEIAKTTDENIKKALLRELSNRSSQSVEVIENQCFN